MKLSEENIIKVLVIDDSAFMRKSLTMMLESDPEIRVIATARDGHDGIDKIARMKPDIVTLDIEMPGMDGLTALKIIMEQMPLPVLMVSALTTESAQATLQALDLGAVDFIPKDLSYSSTNIKNIKSDLIDKIKQISRSKLVQTRFRMRRLAQSTRDHKPAGKQKPHRNISLNSLMPKLQAVTIGISTGGPQALLKVIPNIPKNFPLGFAIVQHMPPNFTKTLADRLNGISKVKVKEAENGEPFEAGKILIAPGGKQMTFSYNGSQVITEISDEPRNILYKPSADLMMNSAASTFKGPVLGIIMTGMGKDGVEGLTQIRSKGGYVIAQNEESCIIYGMPRAALEEGIVDSILSLTEISQTLERLATSWTQAHSPIAKE